MRNLLQLLWKYHFFLLFLIFEGCCVYLMVINNRYQSTVMINSANSFTAGVNGVVSGVTEYLGLRSENKLLAAENAQLRSLLPGAFYNDQQVMMTVHDSLLKQQYTYVSAKVIGNTTGKRNNYLTLNAGSLKGIKAEMGVISANGIAGIVKDVSENFCTVISVLHKDFHTSAKLKKSSYFGNLEWEGGDPQMAKLTHMPKHVILHKGDTLVTTSHSSIFPEDIVIGTVQKFEVRSGDNFYTVDVKLSTSFSSLSYVYVVNDLFREELKTLQKDLE